MSVSVVAKNTCLTTGEGPYWEESAGCLVYVDITQGDVHRWNSTTSEDTSLHLGLLCCTFIRYVLLQMLCGLFVCLSVS